MDSIDMAGHSSAACTSSPTQVFVQRTQAAGFDLTPVQFAASTPSSHTRHRPGEPGGMIAYDRATPSAA